MKKRVILFTVLPGIIFFSSCNSNRNSDIKDVYSTKKVILIADTTQSFCIEVENKGKSSSNFSVNLNNSFYLDENEIAEQIKNMPPGFPGEPLEHKAWRYVTDNIKFSKSLTSETWHHNPMIMINSIGNGLCDDLASVLNLIWKKLGFQSRVWSLEGHVVPEVFVNDRWQMYDPAHGIYYLNSHNQVAGVEELAAHPEFITKHPLVNETYKCNLFSVAIASSEATAELYSTSSNNHINDFYDKKFEPENLMFTLPPSAIMRFPVHYGEIPSLNLNAYRLPEYAFLSITFSSDKVSQLQIPLVLYAIEGSGKVIIDDSLEFEINSEELKKHLKMFSVFHHQLVFTGEPFNATVYYLVNKRSLLFKTKNTLTLTGLGVNNLFAKISRTENKSSENCFTKLDSILAERLKVFKDNRKDYNAELSAFISDTFNIKNTIGMANLFIRFDKSLTTFQKKGLSLIYEKNINEIVTQLSNRGRFTDKVKKMFSEPEMVLMLLTYIQYCGDDELKKIINNF